MAITVTRGKSDAIIDRLVDTLRTYQADHPDARIDLYRLNSVSVRIRIIDEGFAGQTRAERSRAVWRYLDALDDDVQGDISALILLAPDETQNSMMNLEFEDPSPLLL